MSKESPLVIEENRGFGFEVLDLNVREGSLI